MDNLVIVESPNKVKTIQSFLGEGWTVMASFGHISKLAKSGPDQLGIDLESWIADVQLDEEKVKYFNKIKTVAKKAKKIWIATDADREGEAIGADIIYFLEAGERYARVRYKEITKQAVLDAFKSGSLLNSHLVDAQKARRMLDRVLGFLLSKLMRDKLKNVSAWNLSAGRVQSVALKLVVDKEEQRKAFVPTYYSRIYCNIDDENRAIFIYKDSPFKNKEHQERDYAQKVFEEIKDLKTLEVSDITQTHITKALSIPFKQATVFRASGFNASTTSMALQRLYEGYGQGGLITYPRTDATWLSKSFLKSAHAFVKKHTSESHLLTEIVGYDGDQDAHEAIRPTNISLTPQKAAKIYKLSPVELSIYTLIWEQTIKAVTKAPVFAQTRYEFRANNHEFFLNKKQLVFGGYYDLIEMPPFEVDLPADFKKNTKINIKNFEKKDKESQPPARYTEGTLISKLDEIKVGRPSTFAHTVKRIKSRNYVEVEKGFLIPTPIGEAVLEKLQQGFKDETSESYTAKVEEQLDAISEGKINFKEVLENFWKRFSEVINSAKEKMTVSVVSYQQVGQLCPEDQKELIYKFPKNSDKKFIGCSNFPTCRFTASSVEEIKKVKPPTLESEFLCLFCSKVLVWREGFRGKFLGCSGFPKCKFAVSSEEDYNARATQFALQQQTKESATLKKKTSTKKRGPQT